MERGRGLWKSQHLNSSVPETTNERVEHEKRNKISLEKKYTKKTIQSTRNNKQNVLQENKAENKSNKVERWLLLQETKIQALDTRKQNK
jgi:hypothetical protein